MKRILLILSLVALSFVAEGQMIINASARYVAPVATTDTHPAILDDGHTVAWYDFRKEVTSAGGHVTAWGDQSAANHDLANYGGTPHITANGVLFDGVGDYLKTNAFALNRPEFIYIVLKQVTWTDNDALFDGLTILSAEIVQSYGASPSLALLSWGTSQTDLALDTWGILRVNIVDGTSSFQINEVAAHTTTDAFGDMEGFIIGSRGAGADAWSNIEVKEIIIRDVSDSSGDQSTIYDYLKTHNGL